MIGENIKTYRQKKGYTQEEVANRLHVTRQTISSKEQAESFLRTSIAKAIATGTIEEGQKFGYISTFEFNLSGNLETHIFEKADVDWLHCIAAHRKKKMFIEVEREMEIKLGGGFLGMFGGENHIDQWDEFHCFPVISGLDNIFR